MIAKFFLAFFAALTLLAWVLSINDQQFYLGAIIWPLCAAVASAFGVLSRLPW